MLSLITPLRGLVVLFGVTVIAAARPPRPSATEWQIGEIERGSIQLTDDGGMFVLHRRVGSRCTDAWLIVRFHGALSPTVCDGVTVAVEGESLSPRDFAAAEVSGFHDGRYDPCWELRCDAEAYDRCRAPRGSYSKFE